MMQVVGEEGTSTPDYVVYLKSELLDAAYLQQNSFDEVDAACPTDRQGRLFRLVELVLEREFAFTAKEQARDLFITLEEQFRDWNYAPDGSPAMAAAEARIRECLAPAGGAP
jgi:V/A-type H+-transporting ATPase subunit A